MNEEVIWSIIYIVIGIGLHYFKKYRNKEYLKKKELHEQFLKESSFGKMEYNIRKTNMEMYQSYNNGSDSSNGSFGLELFISYIGDFPNNLHSSPKLTQKNSRCSGDIQTFRLL
jgi:hypothetical protein